jgi:hypothetical protein
MSFTFPPMRTQIPARELRACASRKAFRFSGWNYSATVGVTERLPAVVRQNLHFQVMQNLFWAEQPLRFGQQTWQLRLL